jgi:Chaperone of endosialidase
LLLTKSQTKRKVTMKTKFASIAPVLLVLFSILHLLPATAFAQGTVFTYQGRVTVGGTNFTGAGQFKFALVTSTNANHTATATANTPSGGFITGYTVVDGGNGYVTAPAVTVFGGGGSGAAATAHLTGDAVTSLSVANSGDGNYTLAPTVLIAPPPPNISYTTYWSNDGTSADGSEPSAAVSVAVSNGLFTVVLGNTTQPNMMAISASLFNQPNLQLRIWFNDGVNGFAALDPAQNLTPAPYATFANLVNGLTIQQNSSGAPNVIGGASVNYVSNTVVGATIAGGGTTNYYGYSYTNSVTANYGTVGGGLQDTAGGTFATVSGGQANTASGQWATVGGGEDNTASGGNSTVGGGSFNTASSESATVSGGNGNTASNSYATVSGGIGNIASGDYSTVSGGSDNKASGFDATVGGGDGNIASALSATVGGGEGNMASGNYSFAAGYNAQALHSGSFVWSDASFGSFSSTANNQFSVRASGGIRLAGDVQLSGGAAYHNLSLSGGNSLGFLYGSYPKYGDGIHLGYNYYADASGADQINNPGGGTSRISAGYGYVSFATGAVNTPPTDRMVVDINGNVGIGTTTPQHQLVVNGIVGLTDGVTPWRFQVSDGDLYFVDEKNNTYAYISSADGSYHQSSDRRLKCDITDLDGALDRLLQLRPVSYRFRSAPTNASRSLGLIAQEVEPLFPEVVGEGTNGMKDLAYSELVPVTIRAIQELNQKLQQESKAKDAVLEKQNLEIQSLRQTVEQLKGLVNQLTERRNGGAQ